MKNASRTKVREATDRGSTLFYHSRRPVDAGQTEGFHIPRAPGRTFTAPAAGALAAGDAPSLFFGSAVTLPDQHAIPFTLCILTGFERGVKRQLHAGISRPCALRLDSAPASPYRICRNVETVPPVNRRLTKFQWLSLAKRPPFRYDGTKEKEGILHGIEGPYRCRPQSGGIDPRAAGRAAGCHPAGRQQVVERPDHAGRRHHRRAVRKAPCVGRLCAVGKGAGGGTDRRL